MVQPGAVVLNDIERAELQQHEAIIERGIGTFVEVGQALLAIRDQRLYRAEYGTFEDYCQKRWGFTSRNALDYMRAAQVVNNLTSDIQNSKRSSSLPPSIVSTKPLVNLEPDQQRKAWQKAVETAPL